jgi:hypothetical protein
MDFALENIELIKELQGKAEGVNISDFHHNKQQYNEYEKKLKKELQRKKENKRVILSASKKKILNKMQKLHKEALENMHLHSIIMPLMQELIECIDLLPSNSVFNSTSYKLKGLQKHLEGKIDGLVPTSKDLSDYLVTLNHTYQDYLKLGRSVSLRDLPNLNEAVAFHIEESGNKIDDDIKRKVKDTDQPMINFQMSTNCSVAIKKFFRSKDLPDNSTFRDFFKFEKEEFSSFKGVGPVILDEVETLITYVTSLPWE